MKKLIAALGGVLALVVVIVGVFVYVRTQQQDETAPFLILHQDTIINADYWTAEPQILSAGYGFDSIIGVNGGEAEVRAVGGTWNDITCTNGQEPERRVLTSSAEIVGMENGFDNTSETSDGLPVVFSHPVLPSTIDHADFRVTLNTGEVITPDAASIIPNLEYNERHVVVIFGEFGNRILPGEDGSVYTVRVEVVADDTPLMLVTPDGLVSAVGMFKESTNSPYEENRGPYLVGAKLNRMSTEGEGAPRLFAGGFLPNDGVALYGDAAQFRLRIYTSGGFSPDGVLGILPTEYARYFRIHAQNDNGDTVLLTETDVDYVVDGGTIRVVGLADLGVKADGANVIYDDCYIEDHDNYIDVILSGDEAAMQRITFLEIPAEGEYDPFYNPGGPGNNPTPGVLYSAAGPPDMEPVIMALDDAMTISYPE